MKLLVLCIVFLLIGSVAINASWYDPGSWFDSAVDHIRDELGRTDAGRVLLSVVDDLEEVSRLAPLIPQITNPVVLASQVVIHGRSPDVVFYRFVDRLDIVRKNVHPNHNFDVKFSEFRNSAKGLLDNTGPSVVDVENKLDRLIGDVASSQTRALQALTGLKDFLDTVDTQTVLGEHDIDAIKDLVDAAVVSVAGLGLSGTESAGVLQSIVEEPSLPDGVYMGDECIIDLEGCSKDSALLERAYYWQYSCFVKGNVGKVGTGVNAKATCDGTWINPWSGNTGENAFASVSFYSDVADSQYDWQRCANVKLTDLEKTEFLDNRVCQYPSGKHDIGTICAVDYISCSYGYYGGTDAARVGTTVYENVVGHGYQYACETTYGTFPIDTAMRDGCVRTVAVGDIEVDRFLQIMPESILEPVESPVVPNIVSNEVTVPNVVNVLGISGPSPNVKNPVSRRGDVLGAYSATVFGRDAIVQVSSDLEKQNSGEQLGALGIENNLTIETLNAALSNLILPSFMASVLGNERISLEIRVNYGQNVNWCGELVGGRIQQGDQCPDDLDTFDADVGISVGQSVFENMGGLDFVSSLDDGLIVVDPNGFLNQIKYSAAIMLMTNIGVFV